MKLKLSLSILLLFAATGCLDKKAPTATNMEEGINHYLAREPQCMAFAANYPTQPITNPTMLPGYDALVTVGLLTRSNAGANASGQPLYSYALTSKGQSTKWDGHDPIGNQQPRVLCYGKLQVDKIINFTEPADDRGVHESHVTYTTKFVNQANWATDPVVVKAWGNLIPPPAVMQRKQTATLGLTNEGWRLSEDM
jgi:hypothetical protein